MKRERKKHVIDHCILCDAFENVCKVRVVDFHYGELHDKYLQLKYERIHMVDNWRVSWKSPDRLFTCFFVVSAPTVVPMANIAMNNGIFFYPHWKQLSSMKCDFVCSINWIRWEKYNSRPFIIIPTRKKSNRYWFHLLLSLFKW